MGDKKIKKVAFVISSLASGGSERVMSELASYAAGKNLEVCLILLSYNVCEYVLDDRVKVIPLCDKVSKYGRLASPWKRFSLLREELKALKPDIIMSFLYTVNLYAILAGKFADIPVVVSERNDPKRSPRSKPKRLARRLVYPFADGCIFQTAEAKGYFSKKIQDKSWVIPNPVKGNLPYADRTNVTKDIYAIGRLEEQKNYPMVISAFKTLRMKHPEYKLHIFGRGFGSGALQNLKEITAGYGLETSVVFEGVVSDVHERIKSGTMYVLSSNFEGMPNALMEAMAMGFPCISTDCPAGGPRELITDQENGLLVPVGDAEAMAEAMEKIISDKAFADRIGEKAKAVRADYSLESMGRKYLECLERLL
jgi:glycosyltransferase involved in cell wall biosynthesis